MEAHMNNIKLFSSITVALTLMLSTTALSAVTIINPPGGTYTTINDSNANAAQFDK